jgi:hypothetical protein
MKAHFGVDSRTKLIHAAVATPANVADSTVPPELLHGKETRVWGDQAYRGQRAVIRDHAPTDIIAGASLALGTLNLPGSVVKARSRFSAVFSRRFRLPRNASALRTG